MMTLLDRSKGGGLPSGGLLALEKYCVITFPNTHSALQAEKVLKAREALPFVIMPVPRKISSGCGLAVKTAPDKADQVVDILKGGNIQIDGIYNINKASGTVEKVI